MSEEEVLDEETEDSEESEASDEELWSQEDEVEGESTEKGTPEVEAEAEEAETEEPKSEDDETEDEEEPEEPQHDYESRYKDLEREFHKRNEDSARLREDFDELRLRDVEREQTLQRVRQGLSETEAPPVDPKDSSSFFNDSDKQTMEEFSELSSTFRKMIQHEMAKAGTTMQDATVQAQQRLKSLEDQSKEQNYQNFLQYHQSYMDENVGQDYRDIDRDADFQAFVLGSPAMTKMMTESTDPIDHASVMQLFLSTQSGQDAWRPPAEPEVEKEVKTSTKRQAKRAAATGLLGNSAPVKTKNLDNLSDDELWEAIPN